MKDVTTLWRKACIHRQPLCQRTYFACFGAAMMTTAQLSMCPARAQLLHAVEHVIVSTEKVVGAGPNMAGKSTVMRGTMAVALLGACGLFAPCDAAAVPYIDAFMLRTFSADAPVEGLSSFAIEMTEMRCVLPQSLIIDAECATWACGIIFAPPSKAGF